MKKCTTFPHLPICNSFIMKAGSCACYTEDGSVRTSQGSHETTLTKKPPMATDSVKTLNPKDVAATNKLTAAILPPIALVYCAAVMRNGASKYGVANWRDEPIKRSVYDDAIERHRLKYMAGELIDKDSKLPHLAHIATNCLILMDAEFNGVLTEDGYYHNNGKLVTAAIDSLDKGKSNAE